MEGLLAIGIIAVIYFLMWVVTRHEPEPEEFGDNPFPWEYPDEEDSHKPPQ